MGVRRKRARDLAEGLLLQNDIQAPPVPVVRIAKMLGLRVVSRPLAGDLSGFLARDETGAVIGVNTQHPPVRQRFTIAHEVGHYLLSNNPALHVDRGFDLRLRDATASAGIEIEEIEANLFAAELLMPPSFIQVDMGDADSVDFFDDSHLRLMAKRYEVSAQALMVRLGALGYH
jgi:Zn-dependent peptidase ImmA (M78 family)